MSLTYNQVVSTNFMNTCAGMTIMNLKSLKKEKKRQLLNCYKLLDSVTYDRITTFMCIIFSFNNLNLTAN